MQLNAASTLHVKTLQYMYYEPFGLGRFATDQSLAKAARDLCWLVFGATRLKETTKNFIFEISLLYVNNNNKYPYEKFLNTKFGISMLVYLY